MVLFYARLFFSLMNYLSLHLLTTLMLTTLHHLLSSVGVDSNSGDSEAYGGESTSTKVFLLNATEENYRKYDRL